MDEMLNKLRQENEALKAKLDAEGMINRQIKALSCSGNLNAALNDMVAEIGRYMSAERAYIFEASDDFLGLICEWNANVTPIGQHRATSLTAEELGEWYNILERGEMIFVEDVEQIKDTNAMAYKYFKHNDIHTSFTAPFLSGGRLSGFIGIDNARKETIANVSKAISFLGAYIGIAIDQKHRQDILRSSKEEQERLAKALIRERKSYREALMKNCEYNFFFDLTDGLIKEEFVTAHEINIIKLMGLSLPVKFDEMTQRYKELAKLRFLEKDMEKHFTCKGLIEEFYSGKSSVITEYYSPVPDIFTRANALISVDEETGHLHAYVIAEDITASKKREEAQRNALVSENEQLNLITSELAENLGSGILAYSLPDRRILLMNQEARRMFDVPDDAVIVEGINIMSRISPEDHQRIHDATYRLANKGDRADYVFHNLKQDGSMATIRCNTRILSFSNGELYVLSSLNEITQQEALEARLEEERRRYRDALTRASLAYSDIDITDGMAGFPIFSDLRYDLSDELKLKFPAHYDDAARAMFNEQRVEVIGGDIEAIRSRKRMLSAFKMGTTMLEVDYKVIRKNIYIHCLVMLYKTGDHIHGSFIFYDESKKRKEEKKRTQLINSIGKIYHGLCYVTLPDRHTDIIRHDIDPKYDVPEECSFDFFKELFIKSVVHEDSQADMAQFFDTDDIQKRLEKTDVTKIEFRRQNYKRVRMNIIAAERDADGTVQAFVIAGYDIN